MFIPVDDNINVYQKVEINIVLTQYNKYTYNKCLYTAPLYLNVGLVGQKTKHCKVPKWTTIEYKNSAFQWEIEFEDPEYLKHDA